VIIGERSVAKQLALKVVTNCATLYNILHIVDMLAQLLFSLDACHYFPKLSSTQTFVLLKIRNTNVSLSKDIRQVSPPLILHTPNSRPSPPNANANSHHPLPPRRHALHLPKSPRPEQHPPPSNPQRHLRQPKHSPGHTRINHHLAQQDRPHGMPCMRHAFPG